MKIAFIGQKGIPAKFGGVERHVEELASEMAKNGHEVFVYVRNNYTDKKLKEYKGVKLIHLPSISTKNLDAISHTFLSSVHALFRDYDVIHYQAIGPSVLSWIIKFFKRKTLLIATFHCQDYYHKKWGWFAKTVLKMGEWVTCNIPDKTITVSKSLTDYVKDKYNIEPENIFNGTRIKTNFDFKFLQKWNLKKDNYAVFVGRLIRHKGVHHLIGAFKKLQKESKVPEGFKLVIVGDGFYTDDYVNELKNLVGNNQNIIFTGSLSGSELRGVFAGAHLFVHPSESEGLSIALLEAMGYGVPILMSDIKENLDVAEGVAETFKTNSTQDLKDKLDEIINGNIDLSLNVQEAKKLVENKYNWESISEKTISLYIRLLCEKKINLAQCDFETKK
ncbi:MAG TPA: glycosyl transferase family 1 [Candidatus Moranbacteria bacterium]|nr:MAG: Glycosyl transferase [Candidatus Moranbacteria bacterium GW2011_GWF1_34_10]HBI16555.1 glycosyl transferase family 1 [Candidatus Moranbacteria bacterium]